MGFGRRLRSLDFIDRPLFAVPRKPSQITAVSRSVQRSFCEAVVLFWWQAQLWKTRTESWHSWHSEYSWHSYHRVDLAEWWGWHTSLTSLTQSVSDPVRQVCPWGLVILKLAWSCHCYDEEQLDRATCGLGEWEIVRHIESCLRFPK